jgi:Zn finger protein HypA/HybF involved in hydrogenase expression
MKKLYLCNWCGKGFYRYKSTVRNENSVFCSRKCHAKFQKEHQNKGEDNNNYKHGKYFNPVCSCGSEKDPRSEICSRCSRRSYPKGSNSIVVEDSIFINCVKNSKSISEVSKLSGAGRAWVSKRIKDLGLDISHFAKCARRPYTIDYLKKNSNLSYSTVKRLVYENNLKKEKCVKCNLGPDWQGEGITLELHHIDGDIKNNELSNLEILCPNCHSQTKNHRGKKSNGTKKRRQSSSA